MWMVSSAAFLVRCRFDSLCLTAVLRTSYEHGVLAVANLPEKISVAYIMTCHSKYVNERNSNSKICIESIGSRSENVRNEYENDMHIQFKIRILYSNLFYMIHTQTLDDQISAISCRNKFI